ncbi:MAG: class I SAM-dependent methyltransferase [Nitrospira sp.]|nr:class I SAM-dependent methyltransferase [Nitrospira sp.]
MGPILHPAFINHRLAADARVRPGLRVLTLIRLPGDPRRRSGRRRRHRTVGIDLAESMLAVVCSQTLGLQQVSFRTGDVTWLPFETGSIDAVISRFC